MEDMINQLQLENNHSLSNSECECEICIFLSKLKVLNNEIMVSSPKSFNSSNCSKNNKRNTSYIKGSQRNTVSLVKKQESPLICQINNLINDSDSYKKASLKQKPKEFIFCKTQELNSKIKKTLDNSDSIDDKLVKEIKIFLQKKNSNYSIQNFFTKFNCKNQFLQVLLNMIGNFHNSNNNMNNSPNFISNTKIKINCIKTNTTKNNNSSNSVNNKFQFKNHCPNSPNMTSINNSKVVNQFENFEIPLDHSESELSGIS